MTGMRDHWLMQHLGLVVSASGGFYVACRLAAVAGYDTSTAFVILSAQGASHVILGSLLPLIPLLPLMVAMSFLMLSVYGVDPPNPRTRQVVAAGLAVVVSAFLAPWPLAIYALVIGLVGMGIGWIPGEARPRPGRARWIRRYVLGALAVSVLVAVTSPSPWLARERLQAQGGVPFTGYVLQRDDADLVVLRREPRGIVRLDSRSTHRMICVQGVDGFGAVVDRLGTAPPLLGLHTRTMTYPECPDPTYNSRAGALLMRFMAELRAAPAHPGG